MKKKLDVHLVEHTHWDREWYFTSDDSRTMLYYDMKFMIEHLEKNQDKFTYDGQSSVIDDFLKYSPEWKNKMKKVVKAKRLYVGPFYTAIDDTVAAGESISRNLEMGIHIAKDIGHSMEVGYLPDTFGHNNQIPQILRMNKIDNLSFYRGLDPEKNDNKLFFNFQSPDGSKVLGHWQPHYTTNGFGPAPQEGQYTEKWFKEKIIIDPKQEGGFSPSVESYEKRSFGLPVSIPIGTDQRPYSKKMVPLTKKMNDKYPQYNFINSSYEEFIKNVVQQIKENKIELKTITSELRTAKTGRVHRTVASSRMDIKQLHFELEQVLINILEPMSILCHLNNINVPWKMIEECWKSMHKSSAHDSYACSNEDFVNRKLKARLTNAIRIARGVIAMLSRIYTSKFVSEKDDKFKKLVLFNYKHSKYNGTYQIVTTVERDFEDGKFQIFDDKKEIKYSILERDNIGTHERDALKLLLHNVEINPFTHKLLEIKYTKENNYVIEKTSSIKNKDIEVEVSKSKITIKKGQKVYDKFIQVALDPSIGDTYDHSPITFNDKKYFASNFKVLENIKKMNTIKIRGSVEIPSGIENWKENKVSVNQDVLIQITILENKLHIHIEAINKADNARMIFLVNSLSDSDSWYHDQQFGIYKRQIKNEYMDNWTEKDSFGYKWKEFPTNLSPLQSFASNNEANLTIGVSGTKEHELIELNKEKFFALTLYRAFGKFGTQGVAYRPGRASGARCDAPDCQLKNQKLQFDFLIDFSKSNLEKQFELAESMHLKNFYIPYQWGLSQTILRWITNIDYYDNQAKKRNFKLDLPKEFQKKQFRTTAIYKKLNGNVIVRLLNVGKEIEVKANGLKMSRTLYNFKDKNLKVPQFGLVNILQKKPENLNKENFHEEFLRLKKFKFKNIQSNNKTIAKNAILLEDLGFKERKEEGFKYSIETPQITKNGDIVAEISVTKGSNYALFSALFKVVGFNDNK